MTFLNYLEWIPSNVFLPFLCETIYKSHNIYTPPISILSNTFTKIYQLDESKTLFHELEVIYYDFINQITSSVDFFLKDFQSKNPSKCLFCSKIIQNQNDLYKCKYKLNYFKPKPTAKGFIGNFTESAKKFCILECQNCFIKNYTYSLFPSKKNVKLIFSKDVVIEINSKINWENNYQYFQHLSFQLKKHSVQ